MAPNYQIETEDDDEQRYDEEVGQIRDKAATVELLDRKESAAVYALFDEILTTHHAPRLMMNPTTRKLGPGEDSQAPSYRVAMRSNLHGDEGTGRVDRVVVVICKEADYLEHGCEIRFEINGKVWDACTELQRRFLVDEAWETVRPNLDRQGRQRLDEHGRRVLLKGKPDVRVFSNVVERSGAAFIEIDRVSRAARDSKVQHQSSFDFRTPRLTAVPDLPAEPAAEPLPDPETIRKNAIAAAKATRAALRQV